ncbi:MAG: hypothetical protein F3743_08800 [Nitrospinae bacterium]|nr:hypothetical protein [Nitrospinota bacterium]MZH05489.1 hypothetical protein [Nitrospinota bacterium]
MRAKLIFIFILIIICLPQLGYSQQLDSGEFLPSSLVSRETAEKQLNRVYKLAGRFKTFHCGCAFDKIQQVSPNICERGSKNLLKNKDLRTLEWVAMMPEHVFGKPLKCWTKNLCVRSDGIKVEGARCCSEVSPKYKKMESDMHNIFPAINRPLSMEGSALYGGMWEYEFCPGEKPAKSIRGNIARAYLYMSYQYKISLREDQEDMLRKWHFEDPPDDWEEIRNDRIEAIQGNRNPFIDHPEWVERVADF